MFCSVSLSGLAGHEVDEGLEGHHACVVGVHQSHDASKLHLTLSQRRGSYQLVAKHQLKMKPMYRQISICFKLPEQNETKEKPQDVLY